MSTIPAETSADASDHETQSASADAVSSQTCDEPLALLDLLADGYAREILIVLSRGSRGGRELADACDCSRPTIYRRLNRLTDAGFVTSELRIDPDGNHCKEFRLRRDSLQISVADGTLTVDADAVSVDE